ncbi:hypothetical protein UY3_13988 [Chelonia mydas]|uniref:Uncharacterized protein n=1 Tax=Chelonia mydas TaxID=8469 RepID=M7B9X0_CHEMY|nr:hypothetical protein UY3_13988 [Chelonia mydas]
MSTSGGPEAVEDEVVDEKLELEEDVGQAAGSSGGMTRRLGGCGIGDVEKSTDWRDWIVIINHLTVQLKDKQNELQNLNEALRCFQEEKEVAHKKLQLFRKRLENHRLTLNKTLSLLPFIRRELVSIKEVVSNKLDNWTVLKEEIFLQIKTISKAASTVAPLPIACLEPSHLGSREAGSTKPSSVSGPWAPTKGFDVWLAGNLTQTCRGMCPSGKSIEIGLSCLQGLGTGHTNHSLNVATSHQLADAHHRDADPCRWGDPPDDRPNPAPGPVPCTGRAA